MAKISLGLLSFRYDCEIFAIPAKFSQCIAKFTVLSPAAIVPLASCRYYYSFPASSLHCSISSSFDILHSWLAEIDRRPYEIDGNQPNFGYDWIDTIIWLPIPAKTIKQPRNAIRSAIGTRTCQLG